MPTLMLVTACGSASCLAKQVVGYQPAGVLEGVDRARCNCECAEPGRSLAAIGKYMTKVIANRPMKFWELVSCFRGDSEAQIVRSVVGSPRWRDQYWDNLLNFDGLVQEQRRDILDQVVPLQLTREICQRSSAKFVLWPTASILREYSPLSGGCAPQAELAKLTILEVHDRYGPAVIEEVREYGSACIG